MKQIVLDDDLRRKLLNLTEPLELCDENGKAVGRLMPIKKVYGPLEPQISEEEIERRSKSNEKRYTTAEVFKYLESL